MSAEKIEEILARLAPDERALVMQALEEEQAGKQDTQQQLMEAVYAYPVVDIEEFIFGNQYLGLPKSALFPNILDLIVAADDSAIREVYVIAGKGSGKSTLVSILMARAVYRVMSYADPSAYFGVLPDVQVGVLNMATSQDQAQKIIFDKFWNLVKRAPFFNPMGNAIYTKTKRHIAFPKNIHALSGHSGYRAYFGYDIYMGALDEADWFKDTEDHSVSEEVFAGVRGSCRTRFPNDYKLFCISVPQAEDGFIWPKYTQAKVHGTPVVFASGDSDSDIKVIS